MNRYLVWCPEHSATIDDARAISANDHESAAEIWADHEDRHSADYLIVGEKWTPTVHVKAVGDDDADTQIFTVTGYMTAVYSATHKPSGATLSGHATTYAARRGSP